MASALSQLPVVAITMGDPAGIGPEVVLKALALHPDVYEFCRPLVVGNRTPLEREERLLGAAVRLNPVEGPEEARFVPGTIDCQWLGDVPADLGYGQLSVAAGEVAYRFVERAAELALQGRVDAICTAPLNKEALHLAGHDYPGHTELLAKLTGAKDVAMMLTAPLPGGGRLRVAHVTTHMGLIDAIESIEPERVRRVVELAEQALRETVSPRSVHIAVCGVNPHAGEGGLFGRREEEEKIVPAIEALRLEGYEVEGPLPADTVFFRAGRGDFDCVVAMYHDQGHGPVKVLGLEGGVNVTLGLPIIRTSVDHGTAFDIAGKGRADERSLVAALEEAGRLSGRGLVPSASSRRGTHDGDA